MLVRASHHKAVVDSINTDRHHLQTELVHLKGELAVARAILRERESRIERLEHDLSQTHADLQQAVLLLGGMSNRPVGKTMFDEDVFKEDSKLPDTFLSPPPDEFLSGEEILQELDGN